MGFDVAATIRASRGRDARAPAVLLEHPHEARLNLGWELGDLVEEEGTAGRLAEGAVPREAGDVRGTTDMAEELVLEHVGRDRRAVEDDEGAAAAIGVRMDRLGDELLARPLLAFDEDADRAPADALDER